MADRTAIEWADATWQITTGCSVISPGCTNCYAMRLAGGRLRHHISRIGLTQDTKAGPVWNGIVRFNEEWLTQPLQWKKARRIFVSAHGDLFHESVPDEWINRVFAVMALAPQHTFLVLTKRTKRMREYLTAGYGRDAPARQVRYLRTRLEAVARGEIQGRPFDRLENHIRMNGWPAYGEAGEWPLPNVWLGVSVEDQKRADERRDDLKALATVGWRAFVSYEPALGPVDWAGWECSSWLISGGESGPGARPSHPDWHRAARDFCKAHGIAYFMKQWGEWDADALLYTDLDGECPPPKMRVGKSRAGRLLDGREYSEMPNA